VADRAKVNKLVLTGFMATGKSQVGAAVASRLGLPLIDTDAEIGSRWGKSPAAIILEDGEERLRYLERVLIAELAADRRPAVIATGGGTLVDPRNFVKIAAVAVVVWLDARAEVVAERVGRSAELRPKLLESGKPLMERIIELMEERRPAYARAHFRVDTSDITIHEVAARVIAGASSHGFTTCKASA